MFFSIVIPSYNRAFFLPNAIDSIIKQEYTNWELIIIDDGSTDNTKEVVKPYLMDERISYFYQKNKERSEARNNGINVANGEFICFVDSDEVLSSDRLKIIYNELKKYYFKVAVYTTDIGFKFPNSSFDYIRYSKHFEFPINPNQLIKTIIGVPQLIIHKDILKKYNFNPEITVGEDVEMLFRISEKYQIIYLPGKTTIFEIEHKNRSVNYENDSNIKQIQTFKLMFRGNHPASKVKWTLKRKKWSEIFLRASFYYCLKEIRQKAIFYAFLAIINNPFKLFKFKLNVLIRAIISPRLIEQIIE